MVLRNGWRKTTRKFASFGPPPRFRLRVPSTLGYWHRGFTRTLLLNNDMIVQAGLH